MPLSGGQYHWVSILAPSRCAKFLSYITGMNTWEISEYSLLTMIQGGLP
jgi:hypothetical protein